MPIENQLHRASLGPLTADESSSVRRADLLLWSECAYQETLPPHSRAQPSPIVRSLEQLAREQATAIVVGCERFETATCATELFNSSLVIDGCRGFQGWYDKLRLAPWSEFIPRCDVSFMNLLSREFSHGREYDVFTLSDKHCGQTYQAALAICYDICFPANFARTAERQPFDMILSCSSEASDSTGWLRTVNLTASRLRAIEFRRSVVRNVQNGHSAYIDGNGRVRVLVPTLSITGPYSVGRVAIDQRRRIYARMGDVFPMTACGLAIAAAAINPLLRRRDDSAGP